MERENDGTLVKRTRLGDKTAFSKLVTKYKPAVYGLAFYICQNLEDAKDIAQEAFLRAYVNLPKLEHPERFAPWLNQITRSVAYNFLSRERRDGLIPVDEIANDFSEDVPSQLQTSRRPQDEVEVKEMLQFILATFDRLSNTNRLTAMLFYMDGLTYEEIAAFQSISVSTVKGRLHQARKQLREGVLTLVEQGLKSQAPGPEFVSSIMVLLGKLENSVSSIHSVQIKALDTDGNGTKHVRISARRGGRFRIDMDDMLYVSDGKMVWQYERDRGVVHLGNPPNTVVSSSCCCFEPAEEDITPPYISEYLPQGFLFLWDEKFLKKYEAELKNETRFHEHTGYMLELSEKSDEHKRHTEGWCYNWGTTPLWAENIFKVDVVRCVLQSYDAPKEDESLIRLGIDAGTYAPVYSQSYREVKGCGCGCGSGPILVTTEVKKLKHIVAGDGAEILFPVEFHIHDDYGQNRTVCYEDVQINKDLDNSLFCFAPPSDAVVMDKRFFGDIHASIAKCESQSEAKPDDVNLHYTLAQLYLQKRPIDWKLVSQHYARVAELQPTPRAFTDLARSYFCLEQYDDAIGAASRALELEPGNAMACYYLAEAYEEKGDVDKYVAYQRRRLDSRDISEAMKLILCGRLGQECSRRQLEQLAVDAEAMIESGKDEIWHHGMVGFCYYHLDQPGKAHAGFREAVRRLMEQCPQQGVGWLAERTMQSLGMYEELTEVYERQLEIFAGQIHREQGIWTKLLGPYLHFERYQEACQIYWNLVTHGRIYAATKRYKGLLWEAMRSWPDELKEIADAMEDIPETPAVCILRSTIYRHETGDTKKAIALAERAVELAPDDPFVHAALGETYFQLSEEKRTKLYAEAAGSYGRAMELDPDQPYHRAMLALCYNGMRRHEEAIQIAEKLSEYPNCDRPSFHSIMGTVYLNAGRTSDKEYYHKAVDEFAQALGTAKGNSKLYYCRLAKSICHDQIGEDEEAEFAYEADSSWWMFRERMYSLRHAENPEGMLKLVRKHLANGGHSDISMLTRLMTQMGEREKLIRFCEEELACEAHPVLYAQLGEIYFEQEHYDRAIQLYEKALELGLSRPGWTRHQLAKAYVEQGQDERAIGLLEDMLSDGSGNWWYDDIELMATLFERMGRKESAAYWADELPSRLYYPERAREIAEVPRTRARMYLLSGQYERALELFQEALRIEPEHAETKLKLTECYEKLGKKDAVAGVR